MQRDGTPVTDTVAAARRLLRSEADIAFRRRAATIVEYLDPQPEDRILDAGCGLGFYLYLLSKISASRLTGLEWDAVRLKEALGDEGPIADLLQGDVKAMPFGDSSFDLQHGHERRRDQPVRSERLDLGSEPLIFSPGGFPDEPRVLDQASDSPPSTTMVVPVTKRDWGPQR